MVDPMTKKKPKLKIFKTKNGYKIEKILKIYSNINISFIFSRL